MSENPFNFLESSDDDSRSSANNNFAFRLAPGYPAEIFLFNLKKIFLTVFIIQKGKKSSSWKMIWPCSFFFFFFAGKKRTGWVGKSKGKKFFFFFSFSFIFPPIYSSPPLKFQKKKKRYFLVFHRKIFFPEFNYNVGHLSLIALRVLTYFNFFIFLQVILIFVFFCSVCSLRSPFPLSSSSLFFLFPDSLFANFWKKFGFRCWPD